MMQTTLNSQEFVMLMLRKWLVIFISCMAGAVFAFFVSKFVVSAQYTSSIMLYVNHISDGAAVNSINIDDLNASRKLVNTYIVILQNDAVLQQVIDRLLETYQQEELERYLPFVKLNGKKVLLLEDLRKLIKMFSVNNTEVLQIQVETKDADLSAKICTIIAELAPPILTSVVKAGTIEVIGAAKPADKPSSPHIMKNTVAGFLLGGILSVMEILLACLMDNRVRDRQSLEKRYIISVLGEVPDFHRRLKKSHRYYGRTEKADRKINADSQDEMLYYVAEAYKSIRTNLWVSLGRQEKNIALFSSAMPDEGKSTTCSNLAITMAQAGIKVLLIDADLRKPLQHKIFQRCNKRGLSDFLTGTCAYEECIHRNINKNLDIICAGTIPPNPSELLGLASMQDLLTHVQTEYQYIFIDTPPVNLVTDAMVLVGKTVGVVLVTRSKRSTYEELTKAFLNITDSNVGILGMIVTDLKRTERDYRNCRYA